MNNALVTVERLIKNYQSLRPLRIQSLFLERGSVVSLMGLDAPAAEMLVGLLTGAVLPDEGEIHLFGKSTRQVSDDEVWLEMLDDLGILTDRAVLIPQFSVEQNIAIPFTLQVDPVAAEFKPQIAQLASQVGLRTSDLEITIGNAPSSIVARVRLARAVALDPIVLIAEHPTASLPRADVKAFAAVIARVARARQLSLLTITADDAFASALGGQVLTLEPASGELKPRSAWRKIFG